MINHWPSVVSANMLPILCKTECVRRIVANILAFWPQAKPLKKNRIRNLILPGKNCHLTIFHYRIVSTASSFMLIAQLDIDDINMDKSGFGLENSLPYCNSKLCLALLTSELGRRCGLHAYALCPGLVNTPIIRINISTGMKWFYRITMSTLSVSADEVHH